MRLSTSWTIPLIFASCLAALPAQAAYSQTDKMKSCAATWNAMPADQKKATTYQKYSSDCLSGKTATAPAAAAAPAIAQANTQPRSRQDRMKACAANWDALKAAGKTGGQTYQQYSSNCLKN